MTCPDPTVTDCDDTENPVWERPEIPIEYDPIQQFFNCETGTCDDSLNTSTPRLSVISPKNPLVEKNLALRNNWTVYNVLGLDGLADKELSFETGSFRAGTIVKASKTKERRVTVTVRICPCGDCDIYQQRRELYELIDGTFCEADECTICCDTGQICFDDFAVRDSRYLILRARCCGVTRDVSVVREGGVNVTRVGQCEEYTWNYVVPNPYLTFPRINTEMFTLEESEVTVPASNPAADITTENSFEKCLTIPYVGNRRGYLKFTINGCVDNLLIRNQVTGATIDFRNRETLRGCGATILNFWRGRQQYTDARGNSLFGTLSTGCTNRFYIEPNCAKENQICISGNNIDQANFFIKVQWWSEFDGFIGLEAEPKFTSYTCGDLIVTEEDLTAESPIVWESPS